VPSPSTSDLLPVYRLEAVPTGHVKRMGAVHRGRAQVRRKEVDSAPPLNRMVAERGKMSEREYRGGRRAEEDRWLRPMGERETLVEMDGCRGRSGFWGTRWGNCWTREQYHISFILGERVG
jgi:hypothetical protein